MQNKAFTLALVAIIGILGGVMIVSMKNKSPEMTDMIQRQEAILASQQRMEQKTQEIGGASQVQLMAKQVELENRIDKLEVALGNVIKSGPQGGPQPGGPPPEDFSKVHDIPVKHSPVIGSKDAKVTIVEFMDFECPFCSRFHAPFKEAFEAYPGKVNMIVKNFPLSFHANARTAAKASFAAAEQGKYKEMTNLLLDNSKNLSPATYEKIAGDLGLDLEKFKADLENNDAKYEDYITQDMQLGTEVGVRGTPTFYINGRKTRSRDLAAIKKEIEGYLNK